MSTNSRTQGIRCFFQTNAVSVVLPLISLAWHSAVPHTVFPRLPTQPLHCCDATMLWYQAEQRPSLLFFFFFFRIFSPIATHCVILINFRIKLSRPGVEMFSGLDWKCLSSLRTDASAALSPLPAPHAVFAPHSGSFVHV